MEISLDHHSPIPLHIQAEELLRTMISQPEYQNGKLLPNEVELSQQLHISRNTLRQAINRLVFEGLLIRKKGYGTHVAPINVLSNARNWLSFSQEMKAQGITVRNFELHVSWKQASNPKVNTSNRTPIMSGTPKRKTGPSFRLFHFLFQSINRNDRRRRFQRTAVRRSRKAI